MHLGQRQRQSSFFMEGEQFYVTKEERDIGVMVANMLKPCTVCQGSLAQLTQYLLVQLTRAFQYRDRRTLIGLYKQYVLPHLDFAVQAWFPWTSKDKVVLENVQKRAIKMVPGLLILQGQSR
jgi:ribonuclease P/MRP protein subunit RPP40